MKIRILFLKPNQWNVKNCITQWGQRHFEVAYVYKIIIVLVEEILSRKIDALKYYSPTIADGKTFVLVFCVL